MTSRESLSFSDFDEAVRKIETLSSNSHEALGNWSLAQCVVHLDQWLSFPMDGFPSPKFPISLMLPVIRFFAGKSLLQTILKDGFKPGTPTVPETVPEADVDLSESIRQLRSTIERFQKFDGQVYPSPIFGAMDLETAKKLQLRHFEHHLSFFVLQ